MGNPKRGGDMEEENNLIILNEKKKKKNKKRKRIEVKMEIVRHNREKSAPLVGYFPSGFDPQKVSASEEDDEPPRVRVFRNKQIPNCLQLVVSPKGSKVNFVGTSYSVEASDDQACTYKLGVLDKETQTLKIVPVASNQIFRLEPRIRGLDVCKSEPFKESKEEEVLTVKEKADKIKDLTNLYGTKKAIAKVCFLAKKTGDPAPKDLERKIGKILINKEALESAGTYMARNIPPHDSTATTPEKAYPLDRIILKQEWDSLLDILEYVQSEEQLASNTYPSFVCNRVHKLMEIQDEVEKKTLACLYSYITHLIKFKDQRSVDNSACAKSHRIPDILYKKFVTMFTDTGKFEPSSEKKDLLISYVLVLTLIADGFKSDPSDIAKDLRMTSMSLRQYYLNLGCKLARVEKLLQVTLTLPLEFPKPMVRRKR
ncbi:RNA polymerase I associated factor [Macleaya cordata]|uniref:RNA polymerase I associated factor n=1 Tax=Macleaya cordata TaxID=56857 RepID=A0A200QNI5_MACCD|nr:RNA polymerase I associated factor [Macleaya cordata]